MIPVHISHHWHYTLLFFLHKDSEKKQLILSPLPERTCVQCHLHSLHFCFSSGKWYYQFTAQSCHQLWTYVDPEFKLCYPWRCLQVWITGEQGMSIHANLRVPKHQMRFTAEFSFAWPIPLHVHQQLSAIAKEGTLEIFWIKTRVPKAQQFWLSFIFIHTSSMLSASFQQACVSTGEGRQTNWQNSNPTWYAKKNGLISSDRKKSIRKEKSSQAAAVIDEGATMLY